MALEVLVSEKTPGVIVLAPVGAIDATTCTVFEDRVDSILETLPKVLILDFAGVTFITSAGLGVVFKARKALEKKGEFALANLQPQVQTVFEIVKALPNQQVFASVAEMDNYLANIQRKIIKETSAS